MRLQQVSVAGYRSLREPVELHIDEHVTVILGANDHGKTNLLGALTHLNADVGFDADRDLNWDSAGHETELPLLRVRLMLDDDERAELADVQRLAHEETLLVERLDALDAEAASREDAASGPRSALEAAATEMARTQAALTQATEALDDEDEATDAVRLARAEHDDAARNHAEHKAALAAAESARDAGLHTRTAVAGRLAQVRGVLEGTPEEDVLAERVAQRQTELDEAEADVAEQLTASEAADEQLKTGTAQYGEGSAELRDLSTAARSASRALAAARQRAQVAGTRQAEAQAQADALAALNDSPDATVLPAVKTPPASGRPDALVFERRGVDGELELVVPAENARLAAWALDHLPQVQLIDTVAAIRDSVSRKELETDDAVFMRGIFHYAGLGPDEWDGIFPQSDTSIRRLERASETLNTTLRESWSQGQRLRFQLRHDSAKQRIELVIDDPAVTSRVVRASRRSSGFTHFFALKTILHAFEQESPASAFVWLFDEPGVFLHPDGQHDLVQVMETLAKSNQVLYSTHSIFMANKNFPARHRLVVKARSGTRLDGKPFRSRWRPAIEALGMSLPGTLLFASRVLLVEGDSDCIMLNAMLQKLIAMGELDRDVNSLAIMSAGDAADAAALVRMLSEGAVTPKLAALFDGDDGGRRRQKALERVRREGLPIRVLSNQTTTEDHMPAAVELFPKALAIYLAKLKMPGGEPPDDVEIADYEQGIIAELDDLKQSNERLPTGLAEWSRGLGRRLAGLDEDPSAVGVAREYAALLAVAERPPAPQLKRSKELARWIVDTLELPRQWLEEDQILRTAIDDELA